MTGNTYFKNAGIILIFFLRIYKTHLFTNSNFVFAVYESMGHKEMDMTGQLNNNNYMLVLPFNSEYFLITLTLL